eukprot:1159500-Pelagomonas_calceolata.AAC.12
MNSCMPRAVQAGHLCTQTLLPLLPVCAQDTLSHEFKYALCSASRAPVHPDAVAAAACMCARWTEQWVGLSWNQCKMGDQAKEQMGDQATEQVVRGYFDPRFCHKSGVRKTALIQHIVFTKAGSLPVTANKINASKAKTT